MVAVVIDDYDYEDYNSNADSIKDSIVNAVNQIVKITRVSFFPKSERP